MSGNVVNEASSAYHSDAKRALMTTDQGHAAFHCQECDDDAPTWRIGRSGDAVVSWACFLHLPDVCMALQRDFETTKLVVTWFTP